MLQQFSDCLKEILAEAQLHPNDCLECIANDALYSYKIPLIVIKNDNLESEPFTIMESL